MTEESAELTGEDPADDEETASQPASGETVEASSAEPEEVDTEASPTVADLELSLAEAHERLLRSMADFENYKKRIARDRVDARRFAALEPVKRFLPIIDNLELAVSAKGSYEGLKSGVELIVVQMKKFLDGFGVHEISALGEPFDPSIHEAIARFEDEEVTEQIVADELQKGYVMDGRLLRPSMVRVAVPVESRAESEDQEE